MTTGFGHEEVIGNLIKKGFYGGQNSDWSGLPPKNGNKEVETEYRQLFQEVLLLRRD